jgi:hypothetical protein
MHSSDIFKVSLNCVVLTTNISLNKKYVLSLDESNIVLPKLYLTKENLSNNLNNTVVQFLKQYIFVSDIELLPQLICLHSNNIPNETEEINAIYGFLVNKTNSLNKCFWIEFDYLQPNTYTELLIEVIQALK